MATSKADLYHNLRHTLTVANNFSTDNWSEEKQQQLYDLDDQLWYGQKKDDIKLGTYRQQCRELQQLFVQLD